MIDQLNSKDVKKIPTVDFDPRIKAIIYGSMYITIANAPETKTIKIEPATKVSIFPHLVKFFTHEL